jgi:membrane protein implicated in regulation of membrane protease activity
MDNFDIIEKLTASFGVGLGVLTTISIALSVPGSLGLTASNLAVANAAVLVILFAWFFLRYMRKKRANESQGMKIT